MPQARAIPQPEQIQPAPPPPKLLATPTTPAAQGPPPQAAHLQSPPPAAPLPAAIGSGAYQPAPPAPVLAPLATANPRKGAEKPPPSPVGTPVADIKFAADSRSLTDEDRQILEGIVPLYRQNPGKLRIVGYASAGSGATEQLNSFRAALDRAQAVAAALTGAGIPADKIQVEAAPAASEGDGRAEVLLER